MVGLHGPRRIGRQRLIALSLLVFGAVRTVFWLVVMIMQLAGVGFVTHLASIVPAVFFISLYANFATDADAVTASFAALFSADSHHDAESIREDQS